MTLSDFITAVVAVLRRRPGDLLPLYVLGIAVTAIVRVVPFVALAIAYLVLATTGRLEPIQTQLAELGSPPSDPNADPEEVEAWVSGLEPVVDQLLTPQLVVLGLVTMAVSVVLFVLLSAAVSAGQLAACYSRLRDNRGLLAGLDGGRRYWLRFLGLFVLELLCWGAVLVGVSFAATLLAGAGSVATGSSAVAVAAVLLAMVVATILLLAVRALFAFAPVAIVVDDAGVFASLWHVGGFLRRQPVEAFFYYIVAFVALVGSIVLASLLSIVNVFTPVSLVSALLLLPALDLLKTATYCGYRDRLAPPEPPETSLRTQLRAGLGRGWTEMTSFVRATPGTHALVVGLGLVGFVAGWTAAEPFVGTFEASIATRLEGWLPPAMALELFGNNWLVALTTAYAGVAFVIPAIVSLLFNGVALGIIARLEVDPTELAAFVVPHGVVEIPAILIASALGISVGATTWRTVQGRARRTDLADALERAFWVLVGVGILLAIAAVIEGFVSPYYYRLFL